MPAPPERLARLQKRFADHIRDPEGRPPPDGIEERRLAIYRRLFFNNVSSLFAANFPVARRILPDSDWRELIRAFLVEHRSTTPLFPEIGREFVRFLGEHPEHIAERPWLAELCHWQFLATRVRNDPAEPDEIEAEPDADLLAGVPMLNPTLRLAQYDWAVNEIRADRLPTEPRRTALAIFRRADDRIGRLRINALTGRLLQLLQENPGIPGRVCLDRLAAEIEHPDPDALARHGAGLLASLRDKGLLLGAVPAGHASG